MAPRILRNHRDAIAAMDFFTVPPATFRILYVWFAIDHTRRRILHFDVTDRSAATWVVQQLRAAFPHDSAIRHLIFDRDAIFCGRVAAEAVGLRPTRTSYQSPWQNGVAERWVGSADVLEIGHNPCMLTVSAGTDQKVVPGLASEVTTS